MEKKLLPNLDLLKFKLGMHTYYGGFQSMYENYLKRMSGCGPTTISNLLMYIGLTNTNGRSLYSYDSVTYKNVLSHMNELWNFVTPGIMGVNNIDIYMKGGIKYGKSKEVNLQSNLLKIDKNISNRATVEEVKSFLLSGLNNNSPIGFLNLDNGRVRNLQSWHWILITGIYYNNNELTGNIYDEGKEIQVDIKKWIETTKNTGGFVYFEVA